MRPPLAAALIGYALVVPFLFGAATEILMTPEQQAAHPLTELFLGYGLLIDYSAVVLILLSGTLWGFASRSERQSLGDHLLAVMPAAYAFFVWSVQDLTALFAALAFGYGAALMIDLHFTRMTLAPAWWFRLQLTVKLAIVAALMVALTI